MKTHIVLRIYFFLGAIGFTSAFTGIAKVSSCIFPGSYRMEPTGLCVIPDAVFMIGFVFPILMGMALLLVTSGIFDDPDE